MKNSKTYPWILVGLLWVVALLNYMDRQMLSTMKPSMMIDIAELQTATNFGLMKCFSFVTAKDQNSIGAGSNACAGR